MISSDRLYVRFSRPVHASADAALSYNYCMPTLAQQNPIPPEMRYWVLMALLAIAFAAVLLILLVARMVYRRHQAMSKPRPRKPGSYGETDPWQEGGRRLQPVADDDEEDDEDQDEDRDESDR